MVCISQNMFNIQSAGSVDFYTRYGFAHFLLHLQKSQQGVFSTLHGHTFSLAHFSHLHGFGKSGGIDGSIRISG